MATLETQYQNYLKENPTSKLTYDEWMEQIWTSRIINFKNQNLIEREIDFKKTLTDISLKSVDDIKVDDKRVILTHTVNLTNNSN
jgi:hypothetical protein